MDDGCTSLRWLLSRTHCSKFPGTGRIRKNQLEITRCGAISGCKYSLQSHAVQFKPNARCTSLWISHWQGLRVPVALMATVNGHRQGSSCWNRKSWALWRGSGRGQELEILWDLVKELWRVVPLQYGGHVSRHDYSRLVWFTRRKCNVVHMSRDLT